MEPFFNTPIAFNLNTTMSKGMSMIAIYVTHVSSFRLNIIIRHYLKWFMGHVLFTHYDQYLQNVEILQTYGALPNNLFHFHICKIQY